MKRTRIKINDVIVQKQEQISGGFNNRRFLQYQNRKFQFIVTMHFCVNGYQVCLIKGASHNQ